MSSGSKLSALELLDRAEPRIFGGVQGSGFGVGFVWEFREFESSGFGASAGPADSVPVPIPGLQDRSSRASSSSRLGGKGL